MTDFAIQQIILVKQNNMAECKGDQLKNKTKHYSSTDGGNMEQTTEALGI